MCPVLRAVPLHGVASSEREREGNGVGGSAVGRRGNERLPHLSDVRRSPVHLERVSRE